MAKKSTSFSIYQQGRPELSRFPLHIGLELIRRLAQKQQNDSNQSPKALSGLGKQSTSNVS